MPADKVRPLDNAAEQSFCRFVETMPEVSCSTKRASKIAGSRLLICDISNDSVSLVLSESLTEEWVEDTLAPVSLSVSLPLTRSVIHQDFFSAHAQDAILIANTVYKTSNVIKYLGAGASSKSEGSSRGNVKGLPSVTMSIALAKGFLREVLTTKQMRVEIWETESGKKGNRWVLGKEVRYSD